MPVPGLEQFDINADRPEEFSRFWALTVAELQNIRPWVEVHDAETLEGGLRRERIEFTSIDGVRIRGYLLVPPWSGEKRPLIVHAHGYNDRYEVMLDWARRGFHVCGFDARGFGRSAKAVPVAREGYVLTGVGSPQSCILRGAVADFLQAAQAAKQLLDGEYSSINFYGFSFGGALALMAAALSRDPDFVVLGQPTFGWNDERFRLARAGSAKEVADYIARHPRQRASVLGTFAFFDTLHFAPLVHGRVRVGIGLDDDVVPSRSVLAVANRFACPAEVRLLPVSHSSDPRESLWRRFDAEWLDDLAHGLPADFGAADRQVRAVLE